MQPDMLTWALGVHGVVLPLSLTGLYRYSDRSSLFAKALEGTDELLLRIRRRVATTIEDELGPVIQRAGGRHYSSIFPGTSSGPSIPYLAMPSEKPSRDFCTPTPRLLSTTSRYTGLAIDGAHGRGR